MKRLLLVAAVSIPAATFAYGGWAVTTVEEVPQYVVAGKPFDLAYSVRQHGTTLLSGLNGITTATSGKATERFFALGLGEGMYRVRVTLPTPGTWDVNIGSGFVKSGVAMTLKVVAAGAPAPAPMSSYDRGGQLFLTKGCASCHSHQLTKEYLAANIGSDLSEPKYSNAYLARFLADPKIKTDWKTEWRMPNLGLKPSEIVALSAFLNQEKK